MSYQAYLDAIEAKTGKTPQELNEARRHGYGPDTKAAVVTSPLPCGWTVWRSADVQDHRTPLRAVWSRG